MKISKIEEDLKFLTNEYPDLKFQLFRSSPIEYINCFVCNVENENTLISSWKDITGLIAGFFQSALDDELSIWNIYLIFCANFEVQESLKYEIENNRFSMRKMVTSETSWDAGCGIDEFINQEILCSDLKLNTKFSYSDKKDNDFISSLHEIVISISDLDKIDLENNEDRLTQINKLVNWMPKSEN